MVSNADKLAIDDPRVNRRTLSIRGHNYHYLHAVPQNHVATVFLIHGWPDLSFGWRYQIPTLLSLGLQVVALDMMGYGGTDAPTAQPGTDELAVYGMKRASDDIAELAKHIGAPRIILGGHDWGGFVVFRVALHHPDLVAGIFSVCTPYTPPLKTYLSLEDVVERVPQFGYQKHLAGPDVEATIKGKDQLRRFLNGMYGARTPGKVALFDTAKGINFGVLPQMGKSRLLSDEEMDYYVEEYNRHGMHGPLNWRSYSAPLVVSSFPLDHSSQSPRKTAILATCPSPVDATLNLLTSSQYRTRKVNFDDEIGLTSHNIGVPVLYIAAERDNVLLPSMSQGMERLIPNLSRGSVPAGHWALWQTPQETNACIKDWFETKLLPSLTSSPAGSRL